MLTFLHEDLNTFIKYSNIKFMKFLLKPNTLAANLLRNKNLRLLFTIAVFILVFIVYRNLGKFLLKDRFINESPFAAEVGYLESHLPNDVISMKKLALIAKITNFRMSVLLSPDEARNQRVLEFLYPIRENLHSKFLFVMNEETVDINCVEKGRDNNVVLYYCS
jgi:hypothetical protein